MKDEANIETHLREHQEYPATREELIETCNQLDDFSAEDKKTFMDKLPDGTYNSAEEVMMALGMNSTSRAM